MMQEVAELQQQQRGTIQHMEAVNKKLQAAEHRQKQMVSFVAKLFQNPELFARLQQIKHQEQIKSSSPRTMRKFLKHQQDEPGKAESSLEGRVVKDRHDLLDLAPSSITPEFDPFAVEQLPKFHLQGMGENIGLESDNIPFQVGNIAADEIVLSSEFLEASELDGGGFSSQGTEDPLFKGKNVNPSEVTPDDSATEKNFPIFSSPGIENMLKDQESWSRDIQPSTFISASSKELWNNAANYDIPELVVSSELSDFWDLGSPLHATGSSDAEKWPGNEYPFGELDDQVRQYKDDRSKKLDR
ncbi:hypothetical protein ACH5RR_005568 [Cinchona calisaya]|uniref:Heat stress transcription factor A-3 n=1 Tax=Cinchona calisaya TaxID=153742 RepID=A0ABD3ALL8_9GENT